MDYIVVLLAIAIEYFFDTARVLKRFEWYPDLVRTVQHKLSRVNPWIWLAIFLLLPPIFILVLGNFLNHLLYFIADWTFGTFVLIYCFGPENSFSLLKQILSQTDDKSINHDTIAILAKIPLSQDPHECDQQLASLILARFNHTIFAPIVWFSLFGLFGVVFYRMVYLLNRYSDRLHDTASFASFTTLLLNALEWIPARMLALIFAFCGHFHQTMRVFEKQGLGDIHSNDDFLQAAGLAAIEPSDTKDDQHILPDTVLSQTFLRRVSVVICVLYALAVIL